MSMEKIMAQAFDSQEIHIMLLFLFLPLLYFIFKQFKSQNPPLPPGPTPWPILGTIHLLKPMTHVTLTNLAQIYGPLMLIRLGTQNLVVGSSPAAAVEILKTNDRVLSARLVPNSVPLTSSQINQMSFWADALSDYLKNIRTICRTELFSSKALVESQAILREEKIMEMVEFLRLKEGMVVNVQQIVFATVFNMFSNVFFSKDFISLEEESGIDEVRGYLRGIIQAISAPNLCDFYPFLGKFDLQGLRKKHRKLSMMMPELWKTIVEERRKIEKGASKDQDFLDILICKGFTDDQINKVFEELFSAGIDTTTSTINRTMAELVSSADSMKKLKEELEIGFNEDFSKKSYLEQLPYLEATVKETLRLHPPAPVLLSHRARETCQVMNYTIPKNARVLVNVWAIGRDPTVWIEPLEYRPERFLNSTLDFKGNDFEFLPFGAGRRICPGLPMAAKVVPLVVASLIYFFDWSLPPHETVNETSLRATSQMIKPLLLIPKARR